MTVVWTDPKTEQQSRMMRDLATRLLVEADPNKLDALIKQLTVMVRDEIAN
jgi:hypothetical protein